MTTIIVASWAWTRAEVYGNLACLCNPLAMVCADVYVALVDHFLGPLRVRKRNEWLGWHCTPARLVRGRDPPIIKKKANALHVD